MPSPVGHMLGGIAAGWLASPSADRRTLAVCALAGAIADIDLFLPVPHRGPMHSVAAALVVGLVTLAVLRVMRSRLEPARVPLAVGVAYGSHVLLDWMGADTSTPRGLMALWPLTSDYFISDVTVFRAISRRYWLPGFWSANTVAVLQELAILGSTVALIAWRRGASRR